MVRLEIGPWRHHVIQCVGRDGWVRVWGCGGVGVVCPSVCVWGGGWVCTLAFTIIRCGHMPQQCAINKMQLVPMEWSAACAHSKCDHYEDHHDDDENHHDNDEDHYDDRRSPWWKMRHWYKECELILLHKVSICKPTHIHTLGLRLLKAIFKSSLENTDLCTCTINTHVNKTLHEVFHVAL